VKVLMTGASGFIGQSLADYLRSYHEVAAPSRSELNLLNEEEVAHYLRHNQFDVIVHAATVRASRRLGSPPNLLEQNCRMFFNLVHDQDAFGKLFFLSSGAVYDRRHAGPHIAEECFDSHVPADDYGFSKYICARFIASAGNLVELRLFGVFGPREDWQIRFLSNACCRAVCDLPIVIRRNVNFDYMDVSDLAIIVDRLMQGEPRHPAYNACSGRVFDLVTLAEKVVRASGKTLPIQVEHRGLGPEYSGDNRRLLEEMPGFRFRDLDDSIGALYRWYWDHRQEIDPDRLYFDV
jgi:UDP-glucose 4-epimerase